MFLNFFNKKVIDFFLHNIDSIINAKEEIRLLESLFIHTNDVILISESEANNQGNLHIIYANPTFTEITGYTLDEVIGKTPLIFLEEKIDQATLDKINTALQNKQSLEVEAISHTKDGREIWFAISLFPVTDETSSLTRWVLVGRNILTQRQVEVALKESEARLQQLAKNNQDALCSHAKLQKQIERERVIVRLTQQIRQSLDLSIILNTVVTEVQKLLATDRVVVCKVQNGISDMIAEAVGDNWTRMLHTKGNIEDLPLPCRQHYFKRQIHTLSDTSRDKVASCVATFLAQFQVRAELVVPIIQQDTTWGVLITHQCSGPRDWQAWEVTLLEQLANQTAIAIQQSELYQKLEQELYERQQVEKLKNEFISILSHELRTPLASIRGSLGLLASGMFKDNPEAAKQMLEIATSDTERLVRLVNDILNLERLEAKKVTLVKQWSDAAKLIQQSLEIMQSLAMEKKIQLSTLPTSAQVWADPDQIIQTLVNLVSNAIRFSPPETTVTLGATTLVDEVLFQVQDQGEGIPHDQLESIFERFQQVNAINSRQKGGTGLGLAICQCIIQHHGGRIWVESVLGEGSIFYFTLPIKPSMTG
jgi:PAS domain S-box-containing protein